MTQPIPPHEPYSGYSYPPGYPAHQYPPPAPYKRSRSLSIAGMVVGVFALMFAPLIGIAFVLAATALLLSFIGWNVNGRNGFAVAGVILGSLAAQPFLFWFATYFSSL